MNKKKEQYGKINFRDTAPSQVYIENDEQKCVYVFNEEPFFAHVEDENLIVGGRIEEHVLIEISNVNLYAEVDLAPNDISNKTVYQLFDVDYLEFIIDETDLKADRIKFRQLIPFGTLELSEIEYNGESGLESAIPL